MGNAVLLYSPRFIRVWELAKSIRVCPRTRHSSRDPEQCGAEGKSIDEGFFDGTDVVSVVAPPCSPVEITGHQVHLFVKHHRTNRKDKLLSYAIFLSKEVINE